MLRQRSGSLIVPESMLVDMEAEAEVLEAVGGDVDASFSQSTGMGGDHHAQGGDLHVQALGVSQ